MKSDKLIRFFKMISDFLLFKKNILFSLIQKEPYGIYDVGMLNYFNYLI